MSVNCVLWQIRIGECVTELWYQSIVFVKMIRIIAGITDDMRHHVVIATWSLV